MGLDFVLYAPAIEGADLKAISALEPYAHVSLMDSHGRKYVVLDSPLRYSSPLGTLSSVSCGRPACALDWWLDSVVHYRVQAKQERCMLVAFTYNELIHLMWLLGDNVGLAQTDTDWGVRRCDTSNAIMERLRASFGRAL